MMFHRLYGRFMAVLPRRYAENTYYNIIYNTIIIIYELHDLQNIFYTLDIMTTNSAAMTYHFVELKKNIRVQNI